MLGDEVGVRTITPAAELQAPAGYHAKRKRQVAGERWDNQRDFAPNVLDDVSFVQLEQPERLETPPFGPVPSPPLLAKGHVTRSPIGQAHRELVATSAVGHRERPEPLDEPQNLPVVG